MRILRTAALVAILAAGCGNVSNAPDGMGGASGGGRIGSEAGDGGQGGAASATGAAGASTGGAAATGGASGGQVGTGGSGAGQGGTPGAGGGAAGAPGCAPPGVPLYCYITLSSVPRKCSTGWVCTIGLDGVGRISQPAGSQDSLCGCFEPSGSELPCAPGTTCPAP